MKTLIKLALLFSLLTGAAFAAGPSAHTKTVEGLSGSLMTKGGGAAEVSRLTGKKYLFIYFSAHWCPPCRKFTPKLVEFYNQNSKNGDFEILFVSSDKNQEAMDGYMSETQMPWVGLKLGNARAKQLKEQFGVSGIPCLVLLDENDTVLASSFSGKTYNGPNVAVEKYLSLK
jgi:nucleoredoxin